MMTAAIIAAFREGRLGLGTETKLHGEVGRSDIGGLTRVYLSDGSVREFLHNSAYGAFGYLVVSQ